jgi:hypothetical protein
MEMMLMKLFLRLERKYRLAMKRGKFTVGFVEKVIPL